MSIEAAAELLYDEYTGTTGRFHTSTQKSRWLTFTAKVVSAAQPAPVGVTDREAVARAIEDTGEHHGVSLSTGDIQAFTDAVLAAPPERTVSRGQATSSEECPGCGHAPGEHMWPLGCQADWHHDQNGVAIGPDGCLCQWAHVTSPIEGRP